MNNSKLEGKHTVTADPLINTATAYPSFNTVTADPLINTVTTTEGSIDLSNVNKYIDSEILEYNVSENKKSIEIVIKQKLGSFFSSMSHIYTNDSSTYLPEKRVLKRIYKVKKGKLKFSKEEVAQLIPPKLIPESYIFNKY
jgi:hypothetical protein